MCPCVMKPFSEQYGDDFRVFVRTASEAAGLTDAVAFDADDLATVMLKNAIGGAFVPIDGAMVRDWDRDWKKFWPGINHGIRLCRLGDIPFARVYAAHATNRPVEGYTFFVVSRANYLRLYRRCKELQKAERVVAPAPVMPAAHRDTLWLNTLGFLAPANLKLIQGYGGRAKRGLLLTGPPGNGKTSACRWILSECERRGWETNIVGPDEYQAARRDCNPATAVKELFRLSKPGVVFFDDMDIALRNRETVKETDDQAVFLGALDGIEVNTGVVYVFTTNCPVDLIDPAFRRPGRIDLIMHFPKPTAELREQLIGRWHADIRAALNLGHVLEDTAGLSYAEIEELKNLLVLRFSDGGGWDWEWTVRQFRENRLELTPDRPNRIGFVAATTTNGKH
jgi:cell division protease FtsH